MQLAPCLGLGRASLFTVYRYSKAKAKAKATGAERAADDARRRASRAAFFARLRARLPVESAETPHERLAHRLSAARSRARM